MKRILLMTLLLTMVSSAAFAVTNVIFTSTPDVTTIDGDLIANGIQSLSIDTKYISTVFVSDNFNHRYNFSLPASGVEFNAVSTYLSLYFTDILDISGLTSSLYDSANNLLSGGSSAKFSNPYLAAGNYYISIAGTAIGDAGGQYTFALLPTQAVPVPAAALLLGAGLLGIVGIRRRQSV